MTIFLLVVLAAVVLLSLGVLCGWSWAMQALEARSRRQAAMQRLINDQWQTLQQVPQAHLSDHRVNRSHRARAGQLPDLPAVVDGEVVRSHLDYEIVS